jgi:hypothetical protein
MKLDFFENVLISFVNNLSTRLMFFSRYTTKDNPIPVYYGGFGDSVYMVEKGKLNKVDDLSKEYIPRCVVALDGIEFDSGSRRLGLIDSNYIFEQSGFESKKIRSLKPIGYEISLGVQIACSDPIQMLKMVQYLQEAFRNPKYTIEFLSSGITSEAMTEIDLESIEMELNTSFNEEMSDVYPKLTMKVNIKGAYPNFGYYSLFDGGHGYDGFNKEAVHNFIDGDLDASKRITKVITTTKDKDTGEQLDQFEVTD